MGESDPSMALSDLSSVIKSSSSSAYTHPAYLHHLTHQIHHNLSHQHDWTSLTIHTHSPLAPYHLLPRPLISGLPPSRIYIHPDEQVEILKRRDKEAETRPEREWVLPSKLREEWSLRKLAEVMDAIGAVPPGPDAATDDSRRAAAAAAKRERTKRVLLATASDDSTVVYYILHDGLVKPRQN